VAFSIAQASERHARLGWLVALKERLSENRSS